MTYKRFSIWQLSPSKWLRRIRGFRLVYTPLLAIVIFTAVMGIILGTLQLQEKTQQESALFRELSFAKQRIQLRFLNNTELLLSISRDLAANSDQEKLRASALDQLENFVLNNHEISEVIWLNENNARQWAMPPSGNKSYW